jgi:hypothetical protein
MAFQCPADYKLFILLTCLGKCASQKIWGDPVSLEIGAVVCHALIVSTFIFASVVLGSIGQIGLGPIDLAHE